jgi:hypothetical protein
LRTAASAFALGAATFALGPGAKADQVFADDVIVQGSLCVGVDCVNNENFGFDTIRMKENNLRIKAQDTSNSGSFPTVDWQLTFNDSTNGGLNKFSVDDVDSGRTPFTIEAGVRNNQLYLDSSNRVGFGTATPAVDLHVQQGNTPTLRLEQDGSSGFTSQTWDIAGNEVNFFVRDVTNGSRLPFRIRPGAPESAIDIAADGDVGIGTSSPAGKLHTSGTGTQLIYFQSSNNGAVQVRMRTDSQNRRFLATNAAEEVKTQIVFNDNSIQLAGATSTGANLWATIDANGITTLGPDCTTPCDAVFDPEVFTVPPIEERAAYMWENMHLPAVGPTGPDQPFNLTEKTAAMLHELEIAHIYIAQQNEVIKDMQARLEAVESQLDR